MALPREAYLSSFACEEFRVRAVTPGTRYTFRVDDAAPRNATTSSRMVSWGASGFGNWAVVAGTVRRDLFNPSVQDNSAAKNRPTGALESPAFVLAGGDVAFTCAGAGGYVALVDGDSRAELLQHWCTVRSSTAKAAKFTAAQLAPFVGASVRLRAVDTSAAVAWGHLAVDGFSYARPPACVCSESQSASVGQGTHTGRG